MSQQSSSQMESMLNKHPRKGQIQVPQMMSAVTAINDCAQTCTACADACLGERNMAELVRCIRRNLDCGDICVATQRLMVRQTETDLSVVIDQLEACISACQVCAEECRQHASMHEHCRLCADACDRCVHACENLLDTLTVRAQHKPS